jgi:hypothetical protein
MSLSISRPIQKRLAGTVSLLAAGMFAIEVWPHIDDTRGQFQPWAVGVIALMVIAVQGLHACKLRMLLTAPPPFSRLLAICLIGNFFGAVFFTQLAGDLCKLWLLRDGPEGQSGQPLAVLRDRLSSCAAVALTLAWALSGGTALSSVAAPFLLIIIAALSTPGERLAGSAWQRLRDRWKRIPEIPIATLNSSMSSGRWLTVHALSLGVQAVGAFAVWAALWWAGASMDGTKSVLLASVSALAVLLPLSAGGIGVREVSSYALLLHWGTGEASAAAGIAHLTLGFLLGAGTGALIGWLMIKPSTFDQSTRMIVGQPGA